MTRRGALVLLSASWPALAQPDPKRLAEFERALEALRVKNNIPGLSAAVVHAQKVVWSKGFGMQDRDQKIAATPDTLYLVASLTKTFASVLLMQLVEQKKLNLDDPLATYLPKTSSIMVALRRPDIHVRHVFTHTSEGKPGEAYRYSGARYSALTFVVEQASGASFRDLLVRNILDKVGMPNSVPGQDSREPRYQAPLKRLATPYRIDKAGQLVVASYPSRQLSASAGVVSTVLDLAKYDVAIDRHELLRRETQEQAWTPAVSTKGDTLPYGLGWFIQRHQGQRLIWHYGYWPGSFSALYLKVPEKQLTLFLLANSDGLSAPFPKLSVGDVLGSEFARLFLDMAQR